MYEFQKISWEHLTKHRGNSKSVHTSQPPPTPPNPGPYAWKMGLCAVLASYRLAAPGAYPVGNLLKLHFEQCWPDLHCDLPWHASYWDISCHQKCTTGFFICILELVSDRKSHLSTNVLINVNFRVTNKMLRLDLKMAERQVQCFFRTKIGCKIIIEATRCLVTTRSFACVGSRESV